MLTRISGWLSRLKKYWINEEAISFCDSCGQVCDLNCRSEKEKENFRQALDAYYYR